MQTFLTLVSSRPFISSDEKKSDLVGRCCDHVQVGGQPSLTLYLSFSLARPPLFCQTGLSESDGRLLASAFSHSCIDPTPRLGPPHHTPPHVSCLSMRRHEHDRFPLYSVGCRGNGSPDREIRSREKKRPPRPPPPPPPFIFFTPTLPLSSLEPRCPPSPPPPHTQHHRYLTRQQQQLASPRYLHMSLCLFFFKERISTRQDKRVDWASVWLGGRGVLAPAVVAACLHMNVMRPAVCTCMCADLF